MDKILHVIIKTIIMHGVIICKMAFVCHQIKMIKLQQVWSELTVPGHLFYNQATPVPGRNFHFCKYSIFQEKKISESAVKPGYYNMLIVKPVGIRWPVRMFFQGKPSIINLELPD